MFKRITKGGGHELLSSKEINIRESVRPDQTFSKYLEIKKSDLKEVVTDIAPDVKVGSKGSTLREYRFPKIDYNGSISFADTKTLMIQYNPELFEAGLLLLHVKGEDLLKPLRKIDQKDLTKVSADTWIIQVHVLED